MPASRWGRRRWSTRLIVRCGVHRTRWVGSCWIAGRGGSVRRWRSRRCRTTHDRGHLCGAADWGRAVGPLVDASGGTAVCGSAGGGCSRWWAVVGDDGWSGASDVAASVQRRDSLGPVECQSCHAGEGAETGRTNVVAVYVLARQGRVHPPSAGRRAVALYPSLPPRTADDPCVDVSGR